MSSLKCQRLLALSPLLPFFFSFFLLPPSSLHTLSSLYLPPFLLPPHSLQCDEPGCEAAFKKHSKLALHKTRHLDDPKPFKLVTNFSKDTSLHGSSLHAYLCTHKHTHTQTHTNTHRCTHDGCSSAFDIPSALKRHLKTHEGTH